MNRGPEDPQNPYHVWLWNTHGRTFSQELDRVMREIRKEEEKPTINMDLKSYYDDDRATTEPYTPTSQVTHLSQKMKKMGVKSDIEEMTDQFSKNGLG